MIGTHLPRTDRIAKTTGRALYTQDVQRCATVSNGTRLDYWDVTYTFGGYEHHVQTMTPPGRSILVNAQGEPRI